MTVYLIEDHYGADNDELVFPNVQSCLSLTAIDSAGRMAGAHLTVATRKAEVDLILAGMKGLIAVPVSMYAIGGTSSFQAHPDATLKFPGAFKACVRAGLGFAGGFRCYDTTPFIPKGVNGACGVMVSVVKDKSSGKITCTYAVHGAYKQGNIAVPPGSVRVLQGIKGAPPGSNKAAVPPTFYHDGWTATATTPIPPNGFFWI